MAGFRCVLVICLLLLVPTGTGFAVATGNLQPAEELYAAGQIEETIEVLMSGDLNGIRRSPAYQGLLGKCYARQGKITDAVSALERGIVSAKLPQDENVLLEMKRLLASCYAATENWSKAISIHESLASDYPTLAPQCLYWAGAYYMKQEKLAEAISAFSKGIAAAHLPPEQAIVLQMKKLRSGCYVGTGDFTNAAPDYESLASDDSGAAVEWLRRAGECYMKHDKLTEAISAFSRGIALAKLPDDQSVSLVMKKLLASCYMGTGDFTNAAPAYESLVSLDPGWAFGWLQWAGECYMKQEKFTEAASALKKGIESAELNQAFEYVREMTRMLAICHILSGDTDKRTQLFLDRIAAAKEALGEEHDSQKRRSLMLFIADSYREIRDFDVAIETYKQLLTDWPRPADEPRFNMALCFDGKKDYDRAIELYKKVVRDDNPCKVLKRFALLNVAKCLRAQGKYREEIEYLRGVTEKYPDNRLEAMLWIGEDSLIYLKEYDEALTALNQVIAEMPPDEKIAQDDKALMKQIAAEARALKVSVLEKQGKVNVAVAAIRDSLSKNTDLSSDEKAQYLDQIAGIYFRANRYGEAVEVFKDVLRLDELPEEMQAKARYHLGLCSDKLGDRALAVDYMNEVVSRYSKTDWPKKARGMLYLWGQLKTTDTDTGGE